MKITDLSTNQVIHCPTKKEREQILKLAEEAGRKFWSVGGEAKFLDCQYGDRTCINVKEGTYMAYSPVEFYKNEGYDILEAKLFLDNTPVGWFFGFANKAGVWGYCGSEKKPNDKPVNRTLYMANGLEGWWYYIGPLLEAPAYVPTYTEWDLNSPTVPKELYVSCVKDPEDKARISVSYKVIYPDGVWGVKSESYGIYSSLLYKFYTLD